MLPILVVVVGFILFVPTTADKNGMPCYADNTKPYLNFATCTAYEGSYNTNTTPVFIENCEPKQFWFISRHGTRYPSSTIIKSLQTLEKIRNEIIVNYDVEQRGQLCLKDLDNLRGWNLQVVNPLTSNLAPQGYSDLHNMAQRFKARFPLLLNQTYDRELFQFRSTSSQRTTASALAFVYGMFGPSNRVYLPEPMEPDLLIKVYNNCTKWLELWPGCQEEMIKFLNASLMQTLLQNVSLRLGFNYTISMDYIDAMYDGCRFDHSWHVNETSPWCAAFSEEELKILEYKEDLLYYYYVGYGSDINTQIGCPPIKDFMDRFSEIEEDKKQPAGVFYFAHSEMLQLILTTLGIAKDENHLTHTNYEEMKNRQWKTSNITTYALNLATVFYKCDSEEAFKVQFYLNEHLLNLDGCHQGLCNWTSIKEKFGSISSNCTLDVC